MKRAIVIAALVLAVAAVSAAPASAKIARGTFAGTTANDDPIGFKVDKRGRVVGLFYEAVTLSCSDGDTLDTPAGDTRIKTPRKEKFAVTKRRKFGISASNTSTGFGWEVDGGFNKKGRKATGTLRVFASFNDQNEQDPNGSIRCESEKMTWSATRAVTRRRSGRRRS
jgi:hypothetical protein